MMGFGKPQLHAKFEVTGSIYYGNIREFVYKNWDKPKWETLYFLESDFTAGSREPMFTIECATFVKLQLQKMGDFYEKPHFTMENLKFWEVGVLWGLKIS